MLGRTPSRIELSENEQRKLLGILDNAVLTPYEDSFAFKEGSARQKAHNNDDIDLDSTPTTTQQYASFNESTAPNGQSPKEAKEINNDMIVIGSG